MRQLLCIALFCIMAFTGCITTRYVAGYEPHVRPLKSLQYEIVGQAQSFTSNFNLLWFFNVTPLANFDRAISDAINQKNGDDLIDVTWWIERQYWIIGTVNIVHIKGKVIKYKE
ncbi:MAG: hypothetical protein N3F66_07015 [Spirochaetes bacterium]|nr:hypothetical protein [Spirochaetota bacterium]